MTDQEFREMLLTTLAEIKEQGKERDDRLEKRLDSMDTRLEKRLDSIESQAKENNDRLEKKLDAIESRLGGVERDVGWVKGKLEG